MEESATYQWIVRKGERQCAQRMLLRQGRLRFGEPDEAATRAVQSITDMDRLETLMERILHASSWADLLATP